VRVKAGLCEAGAACGPDAIAIVNPPIAMTISGAVNLDKCAFMVSIPFRLAAGGLRCYFVS